MVSVPEGLTLGASGLVSRQMKRGDRGSVPASRTFAEMFECEASGREQGALMANRAVASRLEKAPHANGWTKKSDVEPGNMRDTFKNLLLWSQVPWKFNPYFFFLPQ